MPERMVRFYGHDQIFSSPRQSLSRNHRTAQYGEMTLFCKTNNPLTAKSSGTQGTSGASGYCGTAEGGKPWLPGDALTQPGSNPENI